MIKLAKRAPTLSFLKSTCNKGIENDIPLVHHSKDNCHNNCKVDQGCPAIKGQFSIY